jgi:hypothetical protein
MSNDVLNNIIKDIENKIDSADLNKEIENS